MWILDTDHISFFQRQHPLVTQRINAVNAEEIATTIITVEEQIRGRLNIIRRASSPEELVSAYAKLQATLEFFKSINLLYFNQDASICYKDLLNQKNPYRNKRLTNCCNYTFCKWYFGNPQSTRFCKSFWIKI